MRSAMALLYGILIAVGSQQTSVAHAQKLQGFCEAARARLSMDVKLREAVTAAFGRPSYLRRNDRCIYPQQLITYGDRDVLLTIGNEPGEACHGCAAKLSAYVFRRTPNGPRMTAQFVDFAEAGTSGDPGRIDPVQIAGHNALVIESGGTFQGYSSSYLQLHVFDAGQLIEVRPALPFSASNEGAVTDDGKVISVTASWSIGKTAQNEVAINYQVTSSGRVTDATAVWALQGSQLVLKSGRVPAELKQAGGG